MIQAQNLLTQITAKIPSSLKTKLQGINVNVERLFSPVTSFIRGNPLVSTASVGLAGGLVGSAVSKIGRKSSKKKTKKRKKKTTKRRTRRKRKRKRVRRTPRTAGKGKDRSTKRIRYTKKGQPYVITRSGKAKFIKKSSAKRSHRLKGGRY